MFTILVATTFWVSTSINGQSLPDLNPHSACKGQTTDSGKVNCLSRQKKDFDELKSMWSWLDVGIKQSCGGQSSYRSMLDCITSTLDIEKETAGFKFATDAQP
jgi:hypothetical protein